MNIRILLLPAIAIMLLTGCRRDPYLQVYVDNMNAEKRMLEDTLYDLQYDYDCKVNELDKLQDELERLKGDGVGGRRKSDSSLPGSSGNAPRKLFPDIPELKPPTIDEGTIDEGDPSDDADTPVKEPASRPMDEGEGPDDLEPPKLDLGDAGDSLSAAALPRDQQITQLHLDPARTGGFQRDDQPGDDGIVVVFEPRNSEHDFVPLPGRVTVVLIDKKSRARVGRWEFTQADTEAALRRTAAGQGVELKMPWHETPPANSQLQLFVRYWLPDGQTVEDDREITIAPATQLASRWTPRSLPRPIVTPRRVDVAESHEAPSANSNAGDDDPSSEVWKASDGAPRDDKPVRQARRPQWRPYR